MLAHVLVFNDYVLDGDERSWSKHRPECKSVVPFPTEAFGQMPSGDSSSLWKGKGKES